MRVYKVANNKESKMATTVSNDSTRNTSKMEMSPGSLLGVLQQQSDGVSQSETTFSVYHDRQNHVGINPKEASKYMSLKEARLNETRGSTSHDRTTNEGHTATMESNHSAQDASPREESSLLDELQVPEGFGQPVPHVYRCAYPHPEHFRLLDVLGIRTVINLLDQFPDPYKRYITARDIRFIHIPVAGNKESSNDMDAKKVESMLRIICDVSFHPIMIHCRSGKHRTGCIIGCLRMLQGWPAQDICDEYTEYASHKGREFDKQFILNFDYKSVTNRLPREVIPSWVSQDYFREDDKNSIGRSSSLNSSSCYTRGGDDILRRKSAASLLSADELDETPRSYSMPVGNTPTPFALTCADNDAYEFVHNDSSSCDEEYDAVPEEEEEEETSLPGLNSFLAENGKSDEEEEKND